MRSLGLIAGAVLIVGLAFMSRPVVAYTTGSELLNACLVLERYRSQGAGSIENDEWVALTSCASYVGGVKAGLVLGESIALARAGLPDAHVACIPNDSNYEQFARVVLKYLKEHPERLHKPASHLIVFALNEAYPCK